MFNHRFEDGNFIVTTDLGNEVTLTSDEFWQYCQKLKVNAIAKSNIELTTSYPGDYKTDLESYWTVPEIRARIDNFIQGLNDAHLDIEREYTRAIEDVNRALTDWQYQMAREAHESEGI